MHKKMKILVFGNLFVKEDSLAIKLIPKLKKIFPEIEFKEFDPTENLEKEGNKLKIIDVAKGIKKVEELGFEDIEKLEISGYNMHDFDLAYNLRLLKKMSKIDDVRIIVIPQNLSSGDALNQIQLILRKWVAQDIQGS